MNVTNSSVCLNLPYFCFQNFTFAWLFERISHSFSFWTVIPSAQCNVKKGGRLIVAGIFTNGFFYVVRAKTYLSALFFIHWSGEEKKEKSDRASVYKGHLFSHFFIFSVCLLVAAESYELSYQCAGGKQALIY